MPATQAGARAGEEGQETPESAAAGMGVSEGGGDGEGSDD